MGLMKFIKDVFGGEAKKEAGAPESASPSRESESLALRKQALHYFEIGETDKALDLLDSDVLLAESDKTIKEAFSLEDSGEIEAALALLEAALGDDPDNASSYYRAKAHIYNNLENHAKALECRDKVVELDAETEHLPEFNFLTGMNYVDRGDAHFQLGDFDAALADFNRAVELVPDNTTAVSKRGDAYFEKGEFEKALRDYNLCFEIKKGEPGWTGYLDRAKVYAALGEFERAIDDCTQAISLSANEESGALGYLQRGEIYFKKGEYRLAVEDFSAEIERYPDYAEVYRRRAEAYRRLQLFEFAAADEEKAEFYESGQTGNIGEDAGAPRTGG